MTTSTAVHAMLLRAIAAALREDDPPAALERIANVLERAAS